MQTCIFYMENGNYELIRGGLVLKAPLITKPKH